MVTQLSRLIGLLALAAGMIVGGGTKTNLRAQDASPETVRLQQATGIAQVLRGKQPLAMALPFELHAGDALSTGGNGRLFISLGEAGFLSLGPNGQLELTQVSRERDGSLSLHFKMISGRLHVHMQQMASHRGITEIQTAVSQLIIPGADFNLSVENADTIRLEVDDGLVMVPHGGRVTMVGAGHGVRMTGNNSTLATIKLPASPTLLSPREDMTGTAQSLSFEWQLPGKDFRAQFVVARDARLRDQIYSAVIDPAGHPDLSSLPPGKYYWSVSAISPQGFESLPVQGREFTLIDKLISLPRGLYDSTVFLPPDGCMKFTWDGPPGRYRFRLGPDALFAHPLVDESNLSKPSIQVRIKAPGNYFWQVESLGYSLASPLAKLTVRTHHQFEEMFDPQNSLWSARTNYIDKLATLQIPETEKTSIIGVGVWSTLYSIDAATGAVQWRYQDEENQNAQRFTNYSAPLIVNNRTLGAPRVVYSNGRSHVLCVNALDGKLMWRFKTDGEVYTSPVALETTPSEPPSVLVVDTTNTLYAINPVDGTTVFTRHLTLLGTIRHAPAITRFDKISQAVVSSDGGNVADYALDGTLLWKVNLDSPIETRPLIVETGPHRRSVIVGTQDGHVIALDLSAGSRQWQYPQTKESRYEEISQPVAGDILSNSASPEIVFGTKEAAPSKLTGGSVVMLDAATGQRVWEHAMSIGVFGSFVIADIDLDGTPDIIGETGGTVNIAFALDGPTGAPLFDVTNEALLQKPRGVTSVIIQSTSLEEFPTVPSEATPTPLLADLNGDGLLELVLLDHDFTGLTLYRTLTPANSASNAKIDSSRRTF